MLDASFERILGAWDDVRAAMNRVETALPMQLGPAVLSLIEARDGFEEALRLHNRQFLSEKQPAVGRLHDYMRGFMALHGYTATNQPRLAVGQPLEDGTVILSEDVLRLIGKPPPLPAAPVEPAPKTPRMRKPPLRTAHGRGRDWNTVIQQDIAPARKPD